MTVGRILSAIPAGQMKLSVAFDDGVHATVDLAPIVSKHANLEPLTNGGEFQAVRIAEDGWSIEWPSGIDFGAPQLRRWADEQSGRTMSAERFREWMQRNTLTLDSAAEALGLSRRTIAYYLSGEQPIPRTVMLATEGFEARKVA